MQSLAFDSDPAASGFDPLRTLVVRLREVCAGGAALDSADLDAALVMAAQLAAAAGTPPDPLALEPLFDLDTQAQGALSATRHAVLFASTQPGAALANLGPSARALYGALGHVYADAVAGLAAAAPGRSSGARFAHLTARALWCLGEQAKWLYFDHALPERSLWSALARLYGAIESLGLADASVAAYRGAGAINASCADLYAHALLLGTLNNGALTARQIELGHRWLLRHGRELRIETADGIPPDGTLLAADAEGTPPRWSRADRQGAPGARFVSTRALIERIDHSRRMLRAGRLDLGVDAGDTPPADYAVFLDHAERVWSSRGDEVARRAPRATAAGEPIDVVLGYDACVAAITGAWNTEQASQGADRVVRVHGLPDGPDGGPVRWTLRDKSATGLGILVPATTASALPIGTLVGFRESGAQRWQIGILVRRLATAASEQSLMGVRRLATGPVFVRLSRRVAAAPKRHDPLGDGIPALFTPFDQTLRAVDALLVSPDHYQPETPLTIRVGSAVYRVHMNRVIERGTGWLRVGIEVMGKD
jgi:hypothetical protein